MRTGSQNYTGEMCLFTIMMHLKLSLSVMREKKERGNTEYTVMVFTTYRGVRLGFDYSWYIDNLS